MVPRKTAATTKKATKGTAPVKQTQEKMQTSSTYGKSSTNTMTNATPPRVKFQSAIGRVGNVGSVEELQYSQNGRAWFRFSLGYQPWDANTKTKGETTWYRCTCFGTLAENVATTINVGMRVIVSGRPEINEWTNEEGEKQIQKQIICDGVGPDLAFATAEVSKVYRRQVDQTQNPLIEGYEEEPF